MPKVCPSSTVTTPSLPTLSRASAITSPISGSAAEIAATWAISSLPSTSRDRFWIDSTAASTAFSIPRFRAIGLAPAATFLIPCLTMARARTVAVVVPSPATSFVFVATSLVSWAPRSSHGSSSSTSLAMVTPSLVTVGAPHFLSSTTFRPFGPPRRTSASWLACATPSGAVGDGAPLLLDDGQDVPGRQDQVLLAFYLDLGAAVLRVQDPVADLDVHGDPGAVLEPPGTDCHDLALLGLLLGRVRDHDPRHGGLLLLTRLDHDPVVQGLESKRSLGHAEAPPRSVSTLPIRVLSLADGAGRRQAGLPLVRSLS